MMNDRVKYLLEDYDIESLEIVLQVEALKNPRDSELIDFIMDRINELRRQ
jgi:hypothetical protein